MNKKILIDAIKANIDERFEMTQNAMIQAQNSANSETKSSAGDKYETGRAMAQNERDKFAQQLQIIKQDLISFENINFNQTFNQIQKGALAKTSIGWIMIAVSIGILTIENQNVMVVSTLSPIGKAILHLKINDTILFNGRNIFIESIL